MKKEIKKGKISLIVSALSILILCYILLLVVFMISFIPKKEHMTLESYVEKYKDEDGSILSHIINDNIEQLSKHKDKFVTIDNYTLYEIKSGKHSINNSFVYISDEEIDIDFIINDNENIEVNIDDSIIIFNETSIKVVIESIGDLGLENGFSQININFTNSIFINNANIYSLSNYIIDEIIANSISANEFLDPIFSGEAIIEIPVPPFEKIINYYVYLINELTNINIHSDSSMIFESFDRLILNHRTRYNENEIIIDIKTPLSFNKDNYSNSLITINNWPIIDSEESYYLQYKGLEWGEGNYIDVN